MAREALDTDEKIGLLRSLAFEVRRKRVADEVLQDHIEQQLQLGRRKEWRPVNDALANDGLLAAFRALTLISDETAAVLAAVIEAKDHRLLGDALSRLADYHETTRN